MCRLCITAIAQPLETLVAAAAIVDDNVLDAMLQHNDVVLASFEPFEREASKKILKALVEYRRALDNENTKLRQADNN